MNVNVKIGQFLHCNECCHKDICCIKKDYENEKISIPAAFDDFDIDIKCKHFQKIVTPVFRKVETHFPEIAPDIGTGIEYLQNQPACNVTASTSEKTCKGCEWENNTIRFDQSPCWGCKENGYSKYVKKGSLYPNFEAKEDE